MKIQHPLTAVPLLAPLLLTAVLAGCGSSSSSNGVADKAPTEILAATKLASDAASTVHVSGSIVSGGSPITLDMNLLAGKGGRGKLSENGLAFEVIEVEGTVYIKGSPAFYKHIGGPAAAQLLEGKWLKAPANNSEFASIGQLTDLRQLIDEALANHGSLSKGATSTVNGQKAISLTDKAHSGTLYVATSGTPFPIEITKGGSDRGTIRFDRWNKTVTLAAPPNAIDVAQLKSAGH
jgi:hypothetical protein